MLASSLSWIRISIGDELGLVGVIVPQATRIVLTLRKIGLFSLDEKKKPQQSKFYEKPWCLKLTVSVLVSSENREQKSWAGGISFLSLIKAD